MTDIATKINDILNKLNIKVESIGGQCPVQATGTIFGTAFYFRARGQSYRLAIGEDPVGIPEYDKGWYVKKSWGAHEFDAGYMPVNLALLIIAKHTIDYVNEQKIGCCNNRNIPILADIIDIIDMIENSTNEQKLEAIPVVGDSYKHSTGVYTVDWVCGCGSYEDGETCIGLCGDGMTWTGSIKQLVEEGFIRQ